MFMNLPMDETLELFRKKVSSPCPCGSDKFEITVDERKEIALSSKGIVLESNDTYHWFIIECSECRKIYWETED